MIANIESNQFYPSCQIVPFSQAQPSMRRFLNLASVAKVQISGNQYLQVPPGLFRELSSSASLSQASSGGTKKGGDSGSSKAGGSTRMSKGSSSTLTNNSVSHDKTGNRFIIDLGNKQTGRIEYKSIGKNKIELYHTEVPNELRGKGIGKALAKGALEHVANNNMKVKLTCSYLIHYLDKHADPKYKKLVAK